MKIWDKMRKMSRRITATHRMKRRWRKKIMSRLRKDIVEQRDRYQQSRVTNKLANTPVNLNVFLILYIPCTEDDNLCNQLYMHQNMYTSDISKSRTRLGTSQMPSSK